jgi:hypothetical protein
LERWGSLAGYCRERGRCGFGIDRGRRTLVKRKVKSAWRNLTGYKFDVGCPIVLPVSRTTCTETGKSREDARAKCQTSHALCSVSDAR